MSIDSNDFALTIEIWECDMPIIESTAKAIANSLGAYYQYVSIIED